MVGEEAYVGPVVIVPPEIHPLFPFKRCDYTATTSAHTFIHALLAVVIQFRRLEGRDKETESRARREGMERRVGDAMKGRR